MRFEDECVDRFSDVFEAHVGLLEQSTSKQYRWERDLLKTFCRKISKNPFKLNDVDCLNWAQWRMNRPGHASRKQPGKKQTVTACTVFCAAIRWRRIWRRAIDCGYVQGNPWQSVMDMLRKKSKPGQRAPTEAMSDEDIKRLLNFCDLTTKNGRRDHCFFCLLFGGGLRLNEAATVLIENILSEHDGIFTIILPKTKSGFQQAQQMPEWCSESISRLIKQRREEGARKEDPLFIVYRGKNEAIYKRQYTHEAWRKRWEIYRDKLGLSPNYTPHSGRASACTKLLSLGIDRKAVQDFMRHATLRMIEQYDKRRFIGKNHASKNLTY